MAKDQYKQNGPAVIKPNVKSPEAKKQDSVDAEIKDLKATVASHLKVIDKLARDVKRLKDQISELAGRIPRG